MVAVLLALAFPACAALALLAVGGDEVLTADAVAPFVALAATGVAGLATVALAVARERRRRLPALPRGAEAVLAGAVSALGDAALALDAQGRIAWANAAAAALAGCELAALVGRRADALGEDLVVLLRGLGRGPAEGRVTLAPGGAAQAAAVRLPGRPPLDVVVLRRERPRPEAPRIPVAHVVEDADIVAEPVAPRGAAGDVATALAARVRAGIERAGASAALLRLALPSGLAAADGHLARLERDLGALEAALTALAAPLAPAAVQPVDVGALLSEEAAAVRFAPGVSVRRVGGAVVALADAGQVRQALRCLLRAAAAAMPAGGHLALRAVRRGDEALVEIADTGAGADPGLDLLVAERLVSAQGGRFERVATPGRGAVCRVALRGAERPAARGAPPVAPAQP